MFLMGNHIHTLDDKNRIRLPAKFRDELGSSYMLMPGSGGCIFVYRADESQKLLTMFKNLESFDPEVQENIRAIVSEGDTVDADSQGRFILPGNLMKIAGIEAGDNVVVVGTISKAEIWSEKRWNQRRSQYQNAGTSFDEMYKQLSKLSKANNEL